MPKQDDYRPLLYCPRCLAMRRHNTLPTLGINGETQSIREYCGGCGLKDASHEQPAGKPIDFSLPIQITPLTSEEFSRLEAYVKRVESGEIDLAERIR